MRKTLLLLLSVISIQLLAQVPVGYYDTVDGKKKEELKTALHNVIRSYASLGYKTFTAQFWGDVYYKKTDWNPAGYYWDMYSNEQRAVYNGSDMAREHCMPRSWWRVGADYGDANNDLQNLYPSDSKANGQKSNSPLGEVGISSYDNGVIKVGQNTYPGGYVGKVFEPADEYKGDFARTYFYMVTCYEDYAPNWTTSEAMAMLNNETYPVLKDWALEMLMSWHKNDPVDQKELDRNNAVYAIQYNRNPFIDYPELVDYIWGDKTNQSFTVSNKAVVPTLVTPIASSELNFGSVTHVEREIYVKGALLTQPVNIELVSGDVSMFSITGSTTLSADLVNTGYKLKVKYLAGSDGAHTAKLRLSSSEFASVDVTLIGDYSSKPENIDPIEPAEDMDVMIFYSSYKTENPDSWAKANLPSNFISNAASAPYANGDFSFRKTGENLIVKFDEEPDLMMFALKANGPWGEADNHVYVYESEDGINWGQPIEDFDNTMVIVTYFNTPEIELASTTRAIKIEYVKVANNVGLNNLIVTRAAKMGIDDDALADAVRVYVSGGVLYVRDAVRGSVLAVYDMQGRQVYKGLIESDNESVLLDTKGIFIVRVGDKTFKVMNQ